MNTKAARLTVGALVMLLAIALSSSVATAGSTANAVRAGRPAPPPSLRLHRAPAHVDRVRPGEAGELLDDEETEGAAASASLTATLYYRSAGAYVQPSPRIYIVWWGDWSRDTAGESTRLLNFYKSVGGSAWNNTQTQYGMNCIAGTTNCTSSSTMIRNTSGQLYGTWQDWTPPPSTQPTESQMAAEARLAAYHFGDTGYEAQYIIAMPPGFRDTKSIANGWCAWHNYTTSYNNYLISYTSMPYIPDMGTTCGAYKVNSGSAGYLDGVTIYAGHEYAESETDPFLNAWGDAYGSENADKCLQYNQAGTWFQNVYFSPTGLSFPVQPMWNKNSLLAGGSPCYFWL